jgi:uncharacterized protein YbjT (DUF2867 family)
MPRDGDAVSRLIILGATGSLGRHVLRQALTAGHQVTVFVRTPSKLPSQAQARVSVLKQANHKAREHALLSQ